MSKKFHVIINPASGKPYPILHTLNRLFTKYNIQWSLALTNPDNIEEVAQEAKSNDADMILVYGGDGTICSIAGYLINTEKTLAILPGGTANILSIELEISQNIEKVCEKICQDKFRPRQIDVGRINDRYFLLRVGFGLEAEAIRNADRSSKSRLGILAYALSGLQALIKTRPTRYQLKIDEKDVSSEGYSLIVANSGNLGIPGIRFFPGVEIDDGNLDLILIRSMDLQLLAKFDTEKDDESNFKGLFQHWRAKKISVRTSPKQTTQYDGELLDSSSFEINVLPKSLRILG